MIVLIPYLVKHTLLHIVVLYFLIQVQRDTSLHKIYSRFKKKLYHACDKGFSDFYNIKYHHHHLKTFYWLSDTQNDWYIKHLCVRKVKKKINNKSSSNIITYISSIKNGDQKKKKKKTHRRRLVYNHHLCVCDGECAWRNVIKELPNYYNFVKEMISINPSKHTTSFWRLYNVHNVKTTSYGRQNNVVCVLGWGVN